MESSCDHRRRRHLPWGGWIVAALLVAVLSGTGCVRRRMTVRTSPPGAQIYVDDQEVGTSPASTSFVYYGTRKVTAIKDGYETVTVYNRQPIPWYEYPPLDLISDNFWPLEVRDERVVDIQLVPMQIVPEDVLLNRANALRDNAQAGQTTSLPGAVPGFLLPAQPAPPGAPGAPLLGVPGQGVNGAPPVGTAPLPPSLYPPPPVPAQQPGVVYPPGATQVKPRVFGGVI